MKLSKSLLVEKEYGEKIFKSILEKAKSLLVEVFDLDLKNPDPKIISIAEEPENYRYEIIFNINGRKITALFNFETAVFNFEDTPDEVLREVLRIKEKITSDVQILDKANSYNSAVEKVMDYIEEKYDIDFTPLDQGEENKNVISIEYVRDESWSAVFTSDDYEAEFKAEYKYNLGDTAVLTLTQYREHIIYFD